MNSEPIISKSQYNLSDLKPLSSAQYDSCKESARLRIMNRIGNKPKRANFAREYSSLITPLDGIAFLIFLAALAISSTHIIQLMLQQSVASYHGDANSIGVFISENAYTLIHQVGFIFLAELSAILFLIMHQLRANERVSRKGWTKHISLFGFMALCAASYVFAANLTSGVNTLIAALPPLFTLGIGYRFESIIVEKLRRDIQIDTKYEAALNVWNAAQVDVTNHPEYKSVLLQEVWEKLVSLKANQDYREAPRNFKLMACQRELERDYWTVLHGDEIKLLEPVDAQGGEKQVRSSMGFFDPIKSTAVST